MRVCVFVVCVCVGGLLSVVMPYLNDPHSSLTIESTHRALTICYHIILNPHTVVRLLNPIVTQRDNYLLPCHIESSHSSLIICCHQSAHKEPIIILNPHEEG